MKIHNLEIPSQVQEAMRRYIDETKTLTELSHPNVARFVKSAAEGVLVREGAGTVLA